MLRPIASVALLVACSQTDLVAQRADGAVEDAASPRDGRPPTDATPGFCDGSGPLVLVGDGRTACSGTVAQTTFRYAVCTCEGLAVSAPLTTDAFDSRSGPYTAGEGGGALGTNGRFDAAAGASIGGGLDAGGEALLFGDTELRVRGRLRSAAAVSGEGRLDIDGSARVNGDVRVGSLRVGGTLYTPAGATIETSVDEAPRRVTEPVAVAPPCECAPESLLDVSGLVAAHASSNDNDRRGVPADALSGFEPGRRLELECGRYHFTRVAGEGELTIAASGRVALFVEGDLALTGQLRIELSGDAEVDLFVAGNVVGQARWVLGTPELAARVRVYVGGTGTLELTGGAVFAGNVYAPRAELVTPASVEVFGSLFARRVVASGPLTVHYDRAVLTSGAACPEPGPCTDCLDCGNQACVDGTCGACATDADCCSPLLCAAGTCVPQVL